MTVQEEEEWTSVPLRRRSSKRYSISKGRNVLDEIKKEIEEEKKSKSEKYAAQKAAVKNKMDKTIKTIKDLVKNPSPLIDMVNETIEKNKDNLKKTVDTIETTYSGTLLLLSFHSL